MAAQPLCNFSPSCDVRGSVVVPALIYHSDNGVSESDANEKRYSGSGSSPQLTGKMLADKNTALLYASSIEEAVA